MQGFVGEVLTHDGTFSPELGGYVAGVLQSISDDFAPSAKAEANEIAKFLTKTAAGPRDLSSIRSFSSRTCKSRIAPSMRKSDGR